MYLEVHCVHLNMSYVDVSGLSDNKSLPGRRRDKIIIEGICHDSKIMADNLAMQGVGTSATTLLDEWYISLQYIYIYKVRTM